MCGIFLDMEGTSYSVGGIGVKINIIYDEESHVEGYGSPAGIRVQTFGGKKYSFHAEDCWAEGLEGLRLVRNRLYYCYQSDEITSPRGLAAVFYFIDIWESLGPFIFPTFDYLCGYINEEAYVSTMKQRQTYISREIEPLDPAACSRAQVMSILEPYIPELPEDTIKPYKQFADEVKSLGEIESIDITIC